MKIVIVEEKGKLLLLSQEQIDTLGIELDPGSVPHHVRVRDGANGVSAFTDCVA